MAEGVYEMLEAETRDTPVQAGPWMRLWARLFDLALTKILLFALLGPLLFPLLASWGFIYRILFNAILVSGLYCLIEPHLLSRWGRTPGKILLRILLVKKEELAVEFADYKQRAFQVWIRGLAMGVSPIYLYTVFASYADLKNKGVTLWDEDGGFEVLQGRLDDGRGALAVVLIILVIYVALRLP